MICLDEFGPTAAKSYPGPGWSAHAHRPHFRQDYTRHGYIWAFGALQHRTGAVFRETADTRDPRSWPPFLDGLEAFAPAGDVPRIVDALPLHWTLETMLWNWGHPRFQFVAVPKAAAWPNLIEGFWKILGQRSLAGRDFHNTDTLTSALQAGVTDWNQHPPPFLWERPSKTKRHFKRVYAYRI